MFGNAPKDRSNSTKNCSKDVLEPVTKFKMFELLGLLFSVLTKSPLSHKVKSD